MNKQEIQNKATELKNILSKYKSDLHQLDQHLFDTISEYTKALSEERVKEIMESLKNNAK